MNRQSPCVRCDNVDSLIGELVKAYFSVFRFRQLSWVRQVAEYVRVSTNIAWAVTWGRGCRQCTAYSPRACRKPVVSLLGLTWTTQESFFDPLTPTNLERHLPLRRPHCYNSSVAAPQHLLFLEALEAWLPPHLPSPQNLFSRGGSKLYRNFQNTFVRFVPFVGIPEVLTTKIQIVWVGALAVAHGRQGRQRQNTAGWTECDAKFAMIRMSQSIARYCGV